jgi:hypothetical protein
MWILITPVTSKIGSIPGNSIENTIGGDTLPRLRFPGKIARLRYRRRNQVLVRRVAHRENTPDFHDGQLLITVPAG